MKCKRCDIDHDGSFGSGVFCSRACANSRGPRTEIFKKKVSRKMKGLSPWNAGKNLTKEHREKISKNRIGKFYPRILNEEAFVEGSKIARHVIKKRIIRESLLIYKCSCCGLDPVWNNSPLSLQLDHINGVNNDNRIFNLRFLCPNCHSQQDTYAAKNRIKRKNLSE
jgi:hypothetical protein